MGYQTVAYLRNFELKNHENVSYHLEMIMGKRGLLIGFTNDVWDLKSLRYALWLQRQSFKLARYHINCAMIVPNETYDLTGFYFSMPREIPFPVLADPLKTVYVNGAMERSGYMLLNQDCHIIKRWYIDDIGSFKVKNVLRNFV